MRVNRKTGKPLKPRVRNLGTMVRYNVNLKAWKDAKRARSERPVLGPGYMAYDPRVVGRKIPSMDDNQAWTGEVIGSNTARPWIEPDAYRGPGSIGMLASSVQENPDLWMDENPTEFYDPADDLPAEFDYETAARDNRELDFDEAGEAEDFSSWFSSAAEAIVGKDVVRKANTAIRTTAKTAAGFIPGGSTLYNLADRASRLGERPEKMSDERIAEIALTDPELAEQYAAQKKLYKEQQARKKALAKQARQNALGTLNASGSPLPGYSAPGVAPASGTGMFSDKMLLPLLLVGGLVVMKGKKKR